MDESESIGSSALHQRIAILENDLQIAQVAKAEAEAHLESEHHALESHKAHRKHHVRRCLCIL